MKLTKQMLLLACCCSLWAPLLARAADNRSYGVLSLIGDKMTLVVHVATTGSNFDKNRRDEIPLHEDTFDNAAVLAAGEAIKKISPQSATALFSSSDAELYQLQDKLFEPQDQSKALLNSLKELLQAKHATHLILITKYRADAHLRLRDGFIGSGKLSGIGFYIDETKRMMRSDTGEQSNGFLAPFAYVKLSLVDTETMSVISETTMMESTTLSTARSREAAKPWEVLTAEQKVQALQQIIRQAVAGAMPNVLTAK
jgi:hypothetical protein